MNITSLSNQNLFSAITASTSTSASDSCQSTGNTSGTSSTSDSASVSGPGKLMSELKQLSESNPTEFKKITAEIASQLQSAAGKSSDSNQASFLQSMASNFEKASQSGNFSDLFPQQSSDSSSSSASGSTTSAAQKAYQQGPPPAPPQGQGGDDTISSIFSNALSQIQSDLSSSS